MVLTNSKEHLVDASFLKEPHASQGKASDKSAISLFGKCIGAAEVDLLQVPSCFTNSKLSRKELPKGKQFEKGLSILDETSQPKSRSPLLMRSQLYLPYLF